MHGRRKVLGTCPRGPAVSRHRPDPPPGARTPLLLLPVILALGCAREPVEDLPAAVAPDGQGSSRLRPSETFRLTTAALLR